MYLIINKYVLVTYIKSQIPCSSLPDGIIFCDLSVKIKMSLLITLPAHIFVPLVFEPKQSL